MLLNGYGVCNSFSIHEIVAEFVGGLPFYYLLASALTFY